MTNLIKKIKLSQGKYALVDNEDHEHLDQFSWHYLRAPKDSYGYAVCSTPPYRNKKMHRVILNAKKGQIVDHINHDGLDNRRKNLRIVTASESNRNRRTKNRYGYVGVHKTKDHNGVEKYWIARITVAGERLYLGTFPTALEAGRAYDKAIDKYHNGIGVKNNV
jgi:hypothetical protein